MASFKTRASAVAAMALTAIGSAHADSSTFSDAKNYQGGGSITTFNNNIQTDAEGTFSMLKIVLVLVGLVFVILGLFRLKKSQDQSSGVSPIQGLFLILIGGACAVAPFLLFTAGNTIQGQ